MAKHFTYLLIDPRSGKVIYVGAGSGNRIREHSWAARSSHGNARLVSVIRELDSKGMEIVGEKIFEDDDRDLCELIEISAIEFYGKNNLFNLADGRQGAAGIDFSTERRANHSASQKVFRALPGNDLTGERNPFFGRHHLEETKAKISESKKGKPSPNLGKPCSERAKAKIGAANKGKPSPMLGKHHSEAAKQKLRSANLGNKISPETKFKMSLGVKAAWEKRRKEAA